MAVLRILVVVTSCRRLWHFAVVHDQQRTEKENKMSKLVYQRNDERFVIEVYAFNWRLTPNCYCKKRGASMQFLIKSFVYALFQKCDF